MVPLQHIQQFHRNLQQDRMDQISLLTRRSSQMSAHVMQHQQPITGQKV